MNTANLALILADLPLFANLNSQHLNNLVKDAEQICLSNKEHLFRMGQRANYFYLIMAGTLTLYRSGFNGDYKVFRTAEEGELLVETAMFLDEPEYPLSAQAVGEVCVFQIPGQNLISLCRTSPDFSLAMLSGTAERISQSLNRIDLLTISNAAQRLVIYLMDLYTVQRHAWLVLPVSQAVLARQLNISAETLSRQLKSFRKDGYIGENTPEIVLLNIDDLCQSVGVPKPNLKVERLSAAKRLGSGMFDCCNYSKQILGSNHKNKASYG